MDRLTSLLALFQPQPSDARFLKGTPLETLQHRSDRFNQVHSQALYVLEGELNISIDDQQHKVVKGELIWLPNADAAEVLASERSCWLALSYRFGPMHLNMVFESLPMLLHIPAASEQPELAPILTLLCQEVEGAHCGYQQVLTHLMDVLLIHMLRVVVGSMEVTSGVIGGLSDPRLSRALVSMHDTPEQAWSLSTLAQAAGMSRTAFSQHFKAVVGCPPGEYLKQWRMQLAYQYLRARELSVAQIADRLGYQSETAFRRVFRQVMGVPPGQIRASNS
ncbi:AraC family transcriptional regulator [Neptunomonas marina]|uniref:AraC family transcriptional regulator n=1 Tax=Neptunomonas marina TaxID=1815562 RepID=A0A437Q676_9GAMM|nr:AraC family transcriptional regulator [Neptunomonas marina]RVU30020.1 AraC family transcriptional regulator [Neptunomonas marina]